MADIPQELREAATYGAALYNSGYQAGLKAGKRAGMERAAEEEVFLVMMCDETGDGKASCQEVAVVADLEAFAAYAATHYRDARGTPERGYSLHDQNGADLNWTLIAMPYRLLTAQAIRSENDG